MGLNQDLIDELESTRREFLHLLEAIPEELYGHPSDNPAWTIGDVLYHITLGPPAIRVEIWMIRHARWLFAALMNNQTAGVFNWGNALFARHPKRLTPKILIRAYERGHAGLLKVASIRAACASIAGSDYSSASASISAAFLAAIDCRRPPRAREPARKPASTCAIRA